MSLIPLALAAIVSSGLASSAEPLRLVRSIPIPAVSGRLDHMTIDLNGRRLFVAALENNTVEVVDVRNGRWLESLKDFSKPQGMFYAPDVHKLFVANGTDGTCKVLDGKTLGLIHSETLSLGADLVDYDPHAKQLYVGNGGKDAGNDFGEIAIIDAKTGAKTANVVVQAHPGAILLDDSGSQVYATLPEKAQVLVLDRKTHAVKNTWTLPDSVRTVSLALDAPHHRLFVGTRKPPLVIVLDSLTGKEIARTPTVDTLDGIFFDRTTKRVYATGGEGFVDVQQERDPDHYESIAHVPTGTNARTSLFVPQLNTLFVAVPKTADSPAQIKVFEAQR